MRPERRERRPRGWNGSGGQRKLSKPRRREGRGVSLPVVGIETGTMGKIGAVGRDVGGTKGRVTPREAVRRDVVGVALSLTGRTDPVVLPDADLTRTTNPTALPDVVITPRKRGRKRAGHIVLLDAPNALTDPLRRAIARILLILPPNHPPLSHLRWTSILRNPMTLT